jgi:RND family efflux transporter MFP subunit
MNRRRNTIIVIAGLVLLLLIGFFVSRPKDALKVTLTTVKYGTFSTKLPETGVIQLPRTVTIPAAVPGNMGLINVQAGARVHAGQLLATIVNAQLVSNLHDAEDSAQSAEGRARSASESSVAVPKQNRSSVVQAEANVVQARSQLVQAKQDLVSGSQSGLGYGGQTAEEQRLDADAAVQRAATDLREAQRIYQANQDLYSQKAISKDTLDTSQAKYEEDNVAFQQAKQQRAILSGQLTRQQSVLADRVHAAEDSLRQAQAALDATRAAAGESKLGDLEAARGDAARAEADLSYARDQVSHLSVVAPFDGTIESVATQPNDPLRPLQPGEAVTTGQALFTLAESGHFIVRTRVDEQDVAAIATGQRAIVSGEDFAGKELTGRVVAISPLAQKSDDPSNTSRQVLTTIELDKTLPFLRDGMTVDVDIVTHDQPHVLAIPIDAVHKDDKGKSYVFVVKDSRAVRSDVKLGAQNDTQAVATSGIRAGDVIVADKNAAVLPNVRVTAAPSPSPGPSSSP